MCVIGVFSERPNKFIFLHLVEKMLVKMRRYHTTSFIGDKSILSLEFEILIVVLIDEMIDFDPIGDN
jgi:hypothetical protein